MASPALTFRADSSMSLMLMEGLAEPEASRSLQKPSLRSARLLANDGEGDHPPVSVHPRRELPGSRLKLTFVGLAICQDGPNPLSTTRNGWKALQSSCNCTIFGQTIHFHKGIHILDDSLDGQARAFEHDGAGHFSFDGF
jgi:hypothetical protein